MVRDRWHDFVVTDKLALRHLVRSVFGEVDGLLGLVCGCPVVVSLREAPDHPVFPNSLLGFKI